MTEQLIFHQPYLEFGIINITLLISNNTDNDKDNQLLQF